MAQVLTTIERDDYIAHRQAKIREALDVVSNFDPKVEIEKRIQFLVNYVKRNHIAALVLGISGGVDSTTAGRLCQLAAERCRASGVHVNFVAVRLPHYMQRDENEALHALKFIGPDKQYRINIGRSTTEMVDQLDDEVCFYNEVQEDFVAGNIKARMRMIAQYAVAGIFRGVVVGTDHAAEAVMGFFTKFGDGGADILPLSGLNKTQVRAICAELGAPEDLVYKVPTADLESLRPGLPDEEAHGVSYDAIDMFLAGQKIDADIAMKIIDTYDITAHKRALPVAFNNKG